MKQIPNWRHHMKRSIVTGRLVPAILVVLAVALPAAAHAGPEAPSVPGKIAVGDGHKVFLVGHAVGVQIHECIPATPSGYRWRFVGPRADLYDDSANLLATHFGGPSWQARDGSKVVGTLDAPPVTVDPTAIPWLLLQPTRVTAGPDGDRLAGTTFIQRVATTGGLAPDASTCTAGTAGAEAEVPYTADYVFFKRS
jgi:Protein of unknown function (DUF3455)